MKGLVLGWNGLGSLVAILFWSLLPGKEILYGTLGAGFLIYAGFYYKEVGWWKAIAVTIAVALVSATTCLGFWLIAHVPNPVTVGSQTFVVLVTFLVSFPLSHRALGIPSDSFERVSTREWLVSVPSFLAFALFVGFSPAWGMCAAGVMYLTQLVYTPWNSRK